METISLEQIQYNTTQHLVVYIPITWISPGGDISGRRGGDTTGLMAGVLEAANIKINSSVDEFHLHIDHSLVRLHTNRRWSLYCFRRDGISRSTTGGLCPSGSRPWSA